MRNLSPEEARHADLKKFAAAIQRHGEHILRSDNLRISTISPSIKRPENFGIVIHGPFSKKAGTGVQNPSPWG
jgi:uncharacterized damage-inducible protein DinB